ncbi:hypothetical protein L484_007307 [Morus notabilis]|uniref:Uncharacterized protein n=1 Tax=Morus notabilis TaxID=981085 RepID=W9QWP1_9ROSA|nr:hypothetical protein L484_007307 [Morus notabilis]
MKWCMKKFANIVFQYRMSRGIMDRSNALIYGDKLRCGSSNIADAKLKFSSLRSGSSWINEKKLIMVGSCKTLSKVPLLKLLLEKVEEQSGILMNGHLESSRGAHS